MPDVPPPSEAAELTRATARTRLTQNAGRTAWHLGRMAETAVRLGMTPAHVAALHYAASTVGDLFPPIPTEAPDA